jgi:hypothetical protein
LWGIFYQQEQAKAGGREALGVQMLSEYSVREQQEASEGGSRWSFTTDMSDSCNPFIPYLKDEETEA